MSPADDHEIIRRLLALHWAMRTRFEQTVAEFGLTAAEGRALLELEKPMLMRSVADSLRCDASYITVLTDSLEESGLVERGTDPSDRRVKLLSLTADGRRVRRELMEAIRNTSPALTPLGGSDRSELLRILRMIGVAGSCQD